MSNVKKLENLSKKLSEKNVIGYRVKKSIQNTITNIKSENRKRKNKNENKIIKLNKDIDNKLELLNKVKNVKKVSKKINTLKELNVFGIREDIYQRLREERVINVRQGKMIQHPIDIIGQGDSWNYVKENEQLNYFDSNFRTILRDAHKALYESGNIFGASIQAQYAYARDLRNEKGRIIRKIVGGIKFTRAEDFGQEIDAGNSNSLSFSVESQDSNFEYIYIGYKIVFRTDDGNRINKRTLRDLKAFYPSSDMKYHKMTVTSTTNSKLCIYESFLDIVNVRNLKYFKDTPKKREELNKMLDEEGEDIRNNVTNGYLINSLELLTKKYNNEIVIKFYNNDSQASILVTNGKVNEINKDEYNKYIGKKGMLYNEYHQHVAPFIITEEVEKNDKEKKKDDYKLFPETLKVNKNDDLNDRIVKNVIGFDTEVYRDEKGDCKIFNITCYGVVYDDEIKCSYYGDQESCMDEFIDFIKRISTRKNDRKSRPKEAIDEIFIYGFNNSNFDNLLIYERFYKEDPATKFTMAENSIKKIEYRNVHIFDLSLYYPGKLCNVAKDFKLQDKKGHYPYRFPNAENLDYVGEIPGREYFVSDEDYEGCLKELNNNDFDMEEYTTKYCMQDSKLVYEIAVKHLEQCVQKVNDRVFDCQKCSTGANISKKAFVQTFLKGIINQSPEKIINNERQSYKGGRTEVFKKMFKESESSKLYYYDINSSHPFSMCYEMPYRYINTITYKERLFNEKNLIKHNNYLAKVEYVGDNKNYIPNILTRTEEGDVIACKNTDYSYHWGIELIEAIKGGCKVTVKSEDCYEPKVIFKDFVDYFYNERQNNKETNQSKANFYKLILNSLYGKFGQRKFTKRGIARSANEMYSDLDGKKLISWIDNDEMIIYEYEDEKQKNDIGSLVRFSSYISAISRTRLSEMMRLIGYEHIYYCDTDSIFSDKQIEKKYLSNTQLGKWKDELKHKDMGEITKAIFLSPKCYYYKTTKDIENKKAKSIKAEELKEEDYEDLLYNNKQLISQKRDMFFKSFTGVNIHEVERNICTIYNKRIWNDNNSEPFKNIDEWRKAKQTN